MERARRRWEEIGREILGKVLDAIDYWCQYVSGDPPSECYAAHANLGLYELAEMYMGSSYGITRRDLVLLKRMPRSVYEKLEAKLVAELERLAAVMREEEEEEEEETL